MAPPRKGWENLSPDTRKRLSGAGITRTQYEQGASLRSAYGKAPAKRSTRIGPYGAPRRYVADWDRLKPSTKKRYTGAGITRQSYADGIDLRPAQGKRIRTPIPSGFPEDSQKRVIAGQSTQEDRRNLKAWRAGPSFPSWLPRDPADMDDTTAVILSTIKPAPNAVDAAGRRAGWDKVDWLYNPDGTVTITITPVHGRPFSVTLPDRDSARQLQNVLRNLDTPGIGYGFSGVGYPEKVRVSRTKPRKATTATKKAAAKKVAPAAKKVAPVKKSAAKPKTGTQAAAAKAATKKSAAKRPAKKPAVSKRPAVKRAAAPLGVFDVLASTIEDAIDTATEAIDTAQDTLGL